MVSGNNLFVGDSGFSMCNTRQGKYQAYSLAKEVRKAGFTKTTVDASLGGALGWFVTIIQRFLEKNGIDVRSSSKARHKVMPESSMLAVFWSGNDFNMGKKGIITSPHDTLERVAQIIELARRFPTHVIVVGQNAAVWAQNDIWQKSMDLVVNTFRQAGLNVFDASAFYQSLKPWARGCWHYVRANQTSAKWAAYLRDLGEAMRLGFVSPSWKRHAVQGGFLPEMEMPRSGGSAPAVMQCHAPEEQDEDTLGELVDFRKMKKQAHLEGVKRAAAALHEQQQRSKALIEERQKLQERLDAERSVPGPSATAAPPVGGDSAPAQGRNQQSRSPQMWRWASTRRSSHRSVGAPPLRRAQASQTIPRTSRWKMS